VTNKIKKMVPALQVRAELANVNDQDRTVEVIWSTGSKGIRSGWDGPYYEELSMDPQHVNMDRLNSGAAPVLAVHDKESLDGVIGVVERAWLENGSGKALLRFSATDPNADRAFKKIQERILRNVSVGYKVNEYTDVSQRGDEVPTYRATNWQPQEISIVPVGFDMKATTRSADLTQNEVEIITSSEQTEKEISAMDETQKEQQRQADVAAQEALKQEQERKLAEATETAKAAERTRIQEIRQAVRAAKLDDSYAEDFITRNFTTAEAAKEIFKKMEEQSQKTAVNSTVASVEITRDEKQTKAEGLENYLIHRINSKNTLKEEGKRFFGMHAVRMVEELIGRKMGESDVQLVTRAMTTSDLPNILANVAEKSMRADYQIQSQSFKPWTKPGTLRNYKAHNRLMLGDFPDLEQVNEHGEFKQASMSESKNSIQLGRYGKSIVFTKEMIVNDDLAALQDFSSKTARAAARLESKLVYTSTLVANPTMGDSIALFHASHANLAGSGTAITQAAIAAGFAAMRKQQSLDGDYLDLQPKFLIVGPDKELEALQFISQNMLANQLSNINPYASKLQVVVEPRLTGNQWYLAADPALIDTIEIATLEAEQGPIVVVERAQNGNVKISCEHSVGVAAIDYRGLYKNPGA
jgi:hypothetical protein